MMISARSPEDALAAVTTSPLPPSKWSQLTSPYDATSRICQRSRGVVTASCFWKMLYESAARADEVLCLNVEDLYPQDKRGKITAKGGATEWIHWQSGTAQLLPRLIAGRTRGPLFLTGRKAPAGTATLDVCEETSRARLSYRRGEEIFESPPGCWRTRLPGPRTSRTWRDGHCTGSGTMR